MIKNGGRQGALSTLLKRLLLSGNPRSSERGACLEYQAMMEEAPTQNSSKAQEEDNIQQPHCTNSHHPLPPSVPCHLHRLQQLPCGALAAQDEGPLGGGCGGVQAGLGHPWQLDIASQASMEKFKKNQITSDRGLRGESNQCPCQETSGNAAILTGKSEPM